MRKAVAADIGNVFTVARKFTTERKTGKYFFS